MKKRLKIKKVITDAFYKENYVKINDTILTVTLAKTSYPHLANKIDKISKRLKPFKTDVLVSYKQFPSNRTMLKELLEKRNEIYDKLKLNNITGKGSDIVKAGVIYCYIAKYPTYNDLASEESEMGDLNKFLHSLIQKNIKEYYELKQQLKMASGQDKNLVKKKMDALTKENMELQYKLKEKEIYQNNRAYLKSVYNVLINQKGVCSNFSYAYQFLLNGLGIESLVLSTEIKNEYFGHAMNLNAYVENGVKKYYLVDMTKGNDVYHNNKDYSVFSGFALPEILDANQMSVIFIEKTIGNLSNPDNSLVESIDSTKEFRAIKNNIMKNFELEYYVDKATDFIESGYQPMHLEEQENIK